MIERKKGRKPPAKGDLVDLHPSQWHHEKKDEPFLGENGSHFLLMFALSFPIGAVVQLLITGEFPYWLQPLLQ